MYFPVGWPKSINLSLDGRFQPCQSGLATNRDKDLLSLTYEDAIYILNCKPSVTLLKIKIPEDLSNIVDKLQFTFWRGDSGAIVTATSSGYLLFHSFKKEDQQCLEQVDSPSLNLARESAELFSKEPLPKYSSVLYSYTRVPGSILSISCWRDEIYVSNTNGQVLRFRWDGTLNEEFCFDLEEVPFTVDQLTARTFLPSEPTIYAKNLEYSALIGGYALVFNNGRCALLTSASLFYHPKDLICLWIPRDDVTCTSMNHRYRLIACGSTTSQCYIYTIDDSTGGLQLSHSTILSSRNYPGSPGEVSCVKWSPDGAVMAVAWSKFGLSVWSTFGSLLFSSLAWEAAPDVHQTNFNFVIDSMEWAIDGYQLWFTNKKQNDGADLNLEEGSLYQISFVKSPYTYNSCASVDQALYLHGDDRIYLSNPGLSKSRKEGRAVSPSLNRTPGSTFLDSKLWITVQVPYSYLALNWPIRYCAVDNAAELIAIAGRTGIAYYNAITRRWKLYSNEAQEKDFVVVTCPSWYRSEQLLCGCYDLSRNKDEIRVYSRNTPRLDNSYMKSHVFSCQILLLNVYKDQLIVYTIDSRLSIMKIVSDGSSLGINIDLIKLRTIDFSDWNFHPACLISVSLSSLTAEFQRFSSSDDSHNELLLERGRLTPEVSDEEVYSILLNICGRVLLLQPRKDAGAVVYKTQEGSEEGVFLYNTPIILASCVETFWTPSPGKLSYYGGRSHLTHALWLCCGIEGMRVWIPLFTHPGTNVHMYIAKRIMLKFKLQVYPLAVLCEEAALIGVESDSTVFSSECGWPVSFPYCIFERTTQICLHHIFRQLIQRNLGIHAWELARGCMDLPYFSHSLELLLHEVLEEEATSKEPIPDPLLPSVIEFIQEFPVYLQIIPLCARKTEVAHWPYLFTAVANPRTLFQKCLENKNLNTAASYLIILQTLEPLSISRHFTAQLLDAALENGRWDLAKDLVRFLKAIDPNEVESPKQTTQSTNFSVAPYPGPYSMNCVTPAPMTNNDDEMLLHGKVRHRNITAPNKQQSAPSVVPPGNKLVRKEVIRSTSDAKLGVTSEPVDVGKGVIRKFSAPVQNSSSSDNGGTVTADGMYLEVILHRHVRHLLLSGRIYEIGLISAYLDLPLDHWLKRESNRAGIIDDFSKALRRIHTDFQWPFPETAGKGIISQHQIDKDITDITPLDFNMGLGVSPRVSDDLSNFDVAADEARLAPRMLQGDNVCLSGERSLGYGSSEQELRDSNSDILSDSMFSQLSFADEIKISRSGAQPIADVERQLRFLMDLFVEANCYDWGLLIAIALRDVSAVLHVISEVFRACSNNDVPMRLRNELLSLKFWVDQHCVGYRPVLAAATNHISICLKSVPTIAEVDNAIEPSTTTSLPTECPTLSPLLESAHLTRSFSEMTFASNNNSAIGAVDVETKSLSEGKDSRCSIQ
ncbi:guanine nucleotide exchange factor subunit Rich-like [Artemia franciscana]|uniref:Protein RIC1 homolog n=1 Tax=Artemia franciscana TaxID=6661 RepID=A0AA88I6Z3_ARTSF|nr:hypothetical protein QYM36_001687 [Artemia franciscana]